MHRRLTGDLADGYRRVEFFDMAIEVDDADVAEGRRR